MIRRLTATVVFGILVGCCGSTSGSILPSAAVPPASVPAVVATASPSSSAATALPSRSALVAALPELRLVAVGDSIAYNSPGDCAGCEAFVDRYAAAVGPATGHVVTVDNLSQHNGLQVDGLLAELGAGSIRQQALSEADVIIVGIAHNDAPMNRDDDPCDGAGGDNPDWSKFSEACVAADVAMFTPKYERVFEQIAAMRAGKPTILRALNRYNDWIGWPGHDLSREGIAATKLVVDAWSDMICAAAEANGFTCVDIYTAFNGADGVTPAGDLLAADYTHPSDKGNKVIADALIKLGFAPLVP